VSTDLLQSRPMPLSDAAADLPLLRDQPLKPFTTFKIGGPARYFAGVASHDEFRAALAFVCREGLRLFVLGGGSNILVSDRGFDGLVIHPQGKGVALEHENEIQVGLRIQAAETWDDVVALAVTRGWHGIENLSHIPGQAGAALVQNIGAYGQQISDVFESAEVVEAATGNVRTVGAEDCEFGYRRSVFNTTRKGQLIILSLSLCLRKDGQPNLSYPDVGAYFADRKDSEPSLEEVRRAIITIRDRKFPFPREERGGNAGSFFKNLSLTPAEYERLHRNMQRSFSRTEVARLEEIRHRFLAQDQIKIPSAFLIDICGLKRASVGGAQVNEAQPLVILNQGGATAREVMELAQEIRRTVFARAGIAPTLEPELVGFRQEEIEAYLSVE
jgi:UDP-N-acetylmuramate dehydrogenase